MSHYFMGVLVPKEVEHKDIYKHVDQLMAPYDEDTGDNSDEEGNENGRWDWWVVGGRWDGCITGTEVVSKDNGFNFGDEHHTIEKNCLEITNIEVLKLLVESAILPWALLTPDGEWHDGEYCDDWKTEVIKILSEHVGCRLIGVDYHS